jgi:hypothetical protein
VQRLFSMSPFSPIVAVVGPGVQALAWLKLSIDCAGLSFIALLTPSRWPCSFRVHIRLMPTALGVASSYYHHVTESERDGWTFSLGSLRWELRVPR